MATKKSFKMNPAENFITLPDEEPVKEEAPRVIQEPAEAGAPPEGFKVNPKFIEVKSKRVQLLLQPSIVEALKVLASKKGLSMNEAANEAIKQYIERAK